MAKTDISAELCILLACVNAGTVPLGYPVTTLKILLRLIKTDKFPSKRHVFA